MKKIQLGHHQKGRKYKNPVMWTLVDDEDFEELNKHKWHAMKIVNVVYAGRTFVSTNGKNRKIWMHRVITKTPKGMGTDHINGNGLDNRRKNLRVCSKSQNSMNIRKHSDNTSGFKGVVWHKRDKKWIARIMVDGDNKTLGYFSTALLAHKAYMRACKKLHGEFANYN